MTMVALDVSSVTTVQGMESAVAARGGRVEVRPAAGEGFGIPIALLGPACDVQPTTARVTEADTAIGPILLMRIVAPGVTAKIISRPPGSGTYTTVMRRSSGW